MGKFMSYQYDSSYDVMTQVAAVESLAAQLRDLNAIVSDDQIIAKITSTLPLNGNRNYKSFMSAWNSTADRIKHITLLASRLHILKNMLILAKLNTEPSNAWAFFASKKKGKAFSEPRKDFKSDNRPKRVCASSKNLNRRPNHLEQDCWLKQFYLQGKRTAESGEAMLFHSTGTKPSLRDDSHALKTTDIQFDCDCWYNDSGASEHISDNRTLFKNFEPIPPDQGLIKGVGKSSEALPATGNGIISIRS
jgi:hypothetical protein